MKHSVRIQPFQTTLSPSPLFFLAAFHQFFEIKLPNLETYQKMWDGSTVLQKKTAYERQHRSHKKFINNSVNHSNKVTAAYCHMN